MKPSNLLASPEQRDAAIAQAAGKERAPLGVQSRRRCLLLPSPPESEKAAQGRCYPSCCRRTPPIARGSRRCGEEPPGTASAGLSSTRRCRSPERGERRWICRRIKQGKGAAVAALSQPLFWSFILPLPLAPPLAVARRRSPSREREATESPELLRTREERGAVSFVGHRRCCCPCAAGDCRRRCTPRGRGEDRRASPAAAALAAACRISRTKRRSEKESRLPLGGAVRDRDRRRFARRRETEIERMNGGSPPPLESVRRRPAVRRWSPSPPPSVALLLAVVGGEERLRGFIFFASRFELENDGCDFCGFWGRKWTNFCGIMGINLNYLDDQLEADVLDCNPLPASLDCSGCS